MSQFLIKPGFAGDPIKAYGQRASEYLLRTIKQVPIEFRLIALEALLNEVEPGLYDRVTIRANKYRSQGASERKAVSSALASSMSEGMAKELIKIGQGKAPALRSQVGLSYYGDASKQLALDGLWSSIKDGASKVGSAVKTAAKGIASGAKAAASGVASGASTAWGWGKTAVNKLGSLACAVVSSGAGQVAAGAGGAALGVPPQVGMQGAQVASGMCAKGETPAATQQQLFQPERPAWILPVAIGGVGLVAILLLRK